MARKLIKTSLLIKLFSKIFLIELAKQYFKTISLKILAFIIKFKISTTVS